MAAPEAMGQAALLAAIQKETSRWTEGASSLSDADKAMLLAQLLVLLGQCEPGPLPTPLTDITPQLVPLLQPGADVHVQRNAAALLASLVGTDEDSWRRLVLQDNTLVPAAVQLLRLDSAGSSSGAGTGYDPATCINMMAVLTAAGQGGEEGAQSVINAGALSLVLPLLAPETVSEQVQEAAADVLCQLGAYDTCRTVMMEQGCVAALADALASARNNEIRVRALMGLGMLLPGSPAAQLQLAQHTKAVAALMAAVRQTEDQDINQIARSLFSGLAQNPDCKLHVEKALRAAVAAGPTAAPAASS